MLTDPGGYRPHLFPELCPDCFAKMVSASNYGIHVSVNVDFFRSVCEPVHGVHSTLAFLLQPTAVLFLLGMHLTLLSVHLYGTVVLAKLLR